MTGQDQQGDVYIKRVYRQIIMLALAAHISYVVLFWQLELPALAAYSAASALFYAVMQRVAEKGYFRIVVVCIHIEVSIFASVCTLRGGWGMGTSLYLIALTSLTYFCPFEHKLIPYFFAVLEMCLFLGLKLYMDQAAPNYLAVSEKDGTWLYLYNACICFIMILFAAFSSKLSATVSRRELQAENRSLSALANYDQLTGLLSRHAILKKLKALQGRDDIAVLAISDIDNFKKVNDTWGHNCGDQILSESAELVRCFMGTHVDICRWGGEEFLFLFRDMKSEAVMEMLNGPCRAVEDHPFHFREAQIHITMTVGGSSGLEGSSVEELVAIADKRMYEGKTQGKNRVVFEDQARTAIQRNG